MKRVTGIGGIFFKAKDAPALQAWYKRHLGIDVQEWGGTAFTWTDGEGKPFAGTTVWSIGSAQGDQFAPSTADVPVHFYHGLADGTAPPAHAELYARAVPQARVHRLPGRDHQLNDDLSDVAAAIQSVDGGG